MSLSAERSARAEPLPVAAVVWIALAVAVLAVEPSAIGLSSGETASVDVRRWALLVPTFGAMVVWGLLQQGPRHLAGTPARFLAAAAGWAVLVAPFGASPFGDLLLAVGELAVVVAAVAMVGRFGWDPWMRVVTVTLAVLCVVSVLIDPPVGDRTEGLLASANTLGSHGAIVAVDGLRRWLTTRRMPWLVVPLAGWGAMVAADSRTAMAATIVGTALLARQAVSRELRWPLVSIAFAGLALLATSDVGRDIGTSLTRSGDVSEITTATGRTDIWALDLEFIADRPLTGWGHSGAKQPFLEALDSETIYWDAQEAHNVVLQAGLQSGIPAAILVALAGWALIGRMLHQPWAGRDAIVVVVLLNGLTESLYREPRTIWFILAGAAWASAPGRAGPDRAPGRRSVVRANGTTPEPADR